MCIYVLWNQTIQFLDKIRESTKILELEREVSKQKDELTKRVRETDKIQKKL